MNKKKLTTHHAGGAMRKALIVQERQEWGRGVHMVLEAPAHAKRAEAITSLREVPWIKEKAWVAVMMNVF